jgi:hypothetical protein
VPFTQTAASEFPLHGSVQRIPPLQLRAIQRLYYWRLTLDEQLLTLENPAGRMNGELH